jgi:hypothetical protein
MNVAVVQTQSKKRNNGLPRSWAIWCIVNLLIASFMGLLMRYKIEFRLPFADQTYLLHAHSNFVFCGWVSLTLFSCMIAYLLPEKAKSKNSYLWLFILLEVVSIGLLITCLYQGYGLFSAIFSFLFIGLFYVFIAIFWSDYKQIKHRKEIQWFTYTALIWFVCSTLGPYLIVYFTFAKGISSIDMRALLYFYLHFQYNGWFTFAIFALLLHWLHQIGHYPTARKIKAVFILLTLGVIPGYFLSLIGFYPYKWIEVLSTIAVISHFAAAFVLLFIVVKGYRHINSFITRDVDLLWKTATIAYFLKTALQGATLIPSLAAFAFSFRPLIIGYLHLIFLCFISFFLIGFLLAHGEIHTSKGSLSKLGMIVFYIFVLLNEVMLFGQSYCGFINKYYSFFPALLFWVTTGIFLGLLLFILGQKNNPADNKQVF